MKARDYEYLREVLRVARMRPANGDATEEEVKERRDQLTTVMAYRLRVWWRGLEPEQRDALREADGQPRRVAERVIGRSGGDGPHTRAFVASGEHVALAGRAAGRKPDPRGRAIDVSATGEHP